MRRWRPSAAHTLLLHAAFDRTPAKVASAWSQWLAGGNDILTTDHVSLRLMPVIGKNLARHAVPEAALDRLRGVRRHSFVEHTRYARQLAPVIQSLAAEGVAVVLLGGLVLAQRFYGEVGLRAPSDTALLVAPRDVPAAVRCLRRLGFGPQGQHPATLLGALHGKTNLADQGYAHALRWGRADEIALQWALLPSQVGPGSDMSVLARTTTFQTGELVVRTLSAGDHLLSAVMRGVVHDVTTEPDWIADALAILTSDACATIDWPSLIAEAQRRSIELPLREGLDYLDSEFAVDAIIPEAVLTALVKAPARRERSRIAALTALMPHLDGRTPLDAARVSSRFALHQLATSPGADKLRPFVRPLWRVLKRFV